MRFFITIIIVLISYTSTAQGLSGKIFSENNVPLQDVYVINLSNSEHTHSTEIGTFNLKAVSVNDSLEFRLLGYKTITLQLKNLNNIEIVMEQKSFELDEMILTQEKDINKAITKLDLDITPVNSSQEVLRKVPGLFIGQHAGGGKAEQIFLRGFDIDHGTDIAIQVDGMPVNMVSHAHGQGYSDLHFLIPETIDNIDFGKGAYYANKGDFNTAGYVDFNTKDYLKKNEIQTTIGQFNTLRTVGLFNLLKATNENAFMAVEYIETDGPFESPQNFNRLNLFGKYVRNTVAGNRIELSASHFTSRWDASGQIPDRAVANGSISRFGAIDDTEGGNTSRTNFNAMYQSFISDDLTLNANAFYSYYDFELYSNFTFFLEDPVNGDQIRQKEARDIYGANASLNYNRDYDSYELTVKSGVGLRNDNNNDVELSRSLNRRTTLENIQLGDINQTNMNAFVESTFDFGKFKVQPALRLDYFKFLYNDSLQENFETQSENKTIVSPKLNFSYSASENVELYLKSGTGFHSNDTRVVVANGGEDILPRSYNLDLGNSWKPFSKMIVNSAIWYLFLEQEFVYVGDAGIVEPSGRTRRYGIDLGLRYQLSDYLFLSSDATYTNARSIDDPSGENFIPLAPDFTLTTGISLKDYKGFSGSLQYRYLDDRPANEDNSIIAQGYSVFDFNINYTINNITLGINVENLFDVAWNETQFATNSRLQNELTPVEEIHFTPGTPFFLKGSVKYTF